MESIDQQILALLSKDGRMSFTDIGRETGLSTSAAQQRVRRLEQRGIITGYTAKVNHEELGKALTAFIALAPIDPSEPENVPTKLRAIPEIVSCYSVAGDSSYILMVRVGASSHLETLLSQIRTNVNCSTHTTLVLSVPFEGRLPLD
ncbi:MAG: Lrp/AsnC family transcriptional regulator [Propionibacteriaceae bacterium]